VVAGQIQGVVVEEVEEVEEDSGVKSWAGFMSNSWSGSGVDKLSSPKIFVIVVSVEVGFVGPGLISSEFDSFSTVVRGIVCIVCPPSNCEDKGCSVSGRWVGFVLAGVESQASWDSIQVDRSQVNYCQLSTLLGSSLCRGHQSEKGFVSVSFVWLDPSSSLEGHCV